MFMMASEILTSMGSMTDSMLNGPSNLSATISIESKTERGRGVSRTEPKCELHNPSPSVLLDKLWLPHPLDPNRYLRIEVGGGRGNGMVLPQPFTQTKGRAAARGERQDADGPKVNPGHLSLKNE